MKKVADLDGYGAIESNHAVEQFIDGYGITGAAIIITT